jgi:NAD(P)-dependent dehydrogenase (short-subunit alcohol dehydrogenase family)
VAQTIAITGASAGIGRAAARLFGQRGDRVGLIARGEAGLDAAVRDVQQAGGTALAVPADVADFAKVDAAAGLIEDALGRPSTRSTDSRSRYVACSCTRNPVSASPSSRCPR